jgi:hypothetical protein
MRNVLIHAHIFKNAGTTFDYSLRRSFGEHFVDHRNDELFLQGRNNYLLEYLHANKQVQALSSHSMHFRIRGDEKIRLFPVYFIRHPLARVWSVYRFEKHQTGVNTEGARRAKEMDLNSYVSWYLEEGSPATIRNIHTIFLSGEGPSPDNMDRKFSLARDYLTEPGACFAVVERYVDAMLVLEDLLGDYFPDLDLAYVRKNVTAENPEQGLHASISNLLTLLDDEVKEKLQSANASDLALYQLVNDQLDASLAKIPRLEKKRMDLLKRCKVLEN